MLKSRSAVAALVAVALCASLEVATWKPLMAQAIAAPGIITHVRRGAGSGTGTDLAQAPWGLPSLVPPFTSSTSDHSLVRA